MCPRTQQVPHGAAELLNLFAEVVRKMRQAEEDSCKQFFVVVVFFFPSVEYDLFAHLWIESSPSVAVVIWLFGIQGKKEKNKNTFCLPLLMKSKPLGNTDSISTQVQRASPA